MRREEHAVLHTPRRADAAAQGAARRTELAAQGNARNKGAEPHGRVTHAQAVLQPMPSPAPCMASRTAAHLAAALSLALAALALCCALMPATGARALASQADSTAPEITDRYESLDSLSAPSNPDERVIIDTDTSVLTSVNRALNGLAVRFSGEAVGDILAADAGHKWVNVLGASGTSIGVYITDEQAAQIANLGSYYATGTTIQVEGTYTMACADHQGELDVHATSIKVLDAGGKVTHAPDSQLLVSALGLCLAGFALLASFIALRRRNDARTAAEKQQRR